MKHGGIGINVWRWFGIIVFFGSVIRGSTSGSTICPPPKIGAARARNVGGIRGSVVFVFELLMLASMLMVMILLWLLRMLLLLAVDETRARVDGVALLTADAKPFQVRFHAS